MSTERITNRSSIYTIVFDDTDFPRPEANLVLAGWPDIYVHICYRADESRFVANQRLKGKWQTQEEFSWNKEEDGPPVANIRFKETGSISVTFPDGRNTEFEGTSILEKGPLILQCTTGVKIFNAQPATSNKTLPAADEIVQSPSWERRFPTRRKNAVTIVGSSETVRHFVHTLRETDGDIWALNDALFWLEEEKISTNALFVNDARFLVKSGDRIHKSEVNEIVVLDKIDKSLTANFGSRLITLKTLGRDGVSLDAGSVYHGCTVFHSALQCALASRYRSINIFGVVMPPPTKYRRVDGSETLPEYVHAVQLANIHLGLAAARQRYVKVNIADPHSNLNFL